jgi:hypothetical protein
VQSDLQGHVSTAVVDGIVFNRIPPVFGSRTPDSGPRIPDPGPRNSS